MNRVDKFILAIVVVDGNGYDAPFCVRNPFTHEPDWAVADINLDLRELLEKSERPPCPHLQRLLIRHRVGGRSLWLLQEVAISGRLQRTSN